MQTYECGPVYTLGFTERQLDPSEDVSLPGTYNLGMVSDATQPQAPSHRIQYLTYTRPTS